MHINRLSEYFSPENYKIELKIQKVNRKFSGHVTISGQTTASSNEIRLHTKDLLVESVKVEGKSYDFRIDEDEIIIEGLESDKKHSLKISFSGNITDAMHGLYPCFYEESGQKKELLATQFESHHAREVFPCIDEPDAKATFELTLVTEGTDTVLGNMPIKTQTKTKAGLKTEFEKTPKMSSYLLAWVIGDLHKRSGKTNRGVEVNIWATKAQPLESLDFALDIATRTIDFFDQYFGTHYPLPKSDHVALPDFSSGAMENWGLITYREGALLVHPKETATDVKHYIATVIAHELSHQWFGNLVTMKWWDDLWLNESFATIMEYFAIDKLQPDWNIWEDFVSSDSVAALSRDALDGVQAVKTGVSHPDEIGSLFDGAIVYAKGARLIKMLISYIGEDQFRQGLQQYFKKHAYSNTNSDDLWESLSISSGKDIKSLMIAWLEDPGYPLVKVKKEGKNIKLSQSRFFIGKSTPSTKIWPIPLSSSCSEMPKLFDKKELLVPRTHQTPLLFNIENSAHFIVQYDDELLRQVVDEFANNTLNSIVKFQIINEQKLLVKAGEQHVTKLLPFVESSPNETSEMVWQVIAHIVYDIRSIVEGSKDAEESLKHLAGKIAAKQMQRLGWEHDPSESINDTKLRPIIIGLMLYSEDHKAVEKALNTYKDGIDNIPADIRDLVFRVATKHDPAVFKQLIELHRKTSSSDLQSDICQAVTTTKNQEDIDFLIDSLKDGSLIRPQDHIRWTIRLLNNRHSRDKAWEWLQLQWPWIETQFGGDKSYDYYPRYAASSLNTKQHLAEYKQFFSKLQDNPALKRVIEIGINELTTRVDTIERERPLLIEYLANNN